MTRVEAKPKSEPQGRGGSDPILSVSDLHKTYRLGRVDVPVLRGVSLQVKTGEWLAVRGASGSGKSTLLHLIGGLDRPDRKIDPAKCGKCGYDLRGAKGKCPECGSAYGRGGTILFKGEALSSMSARQLDRYRARNVGFVFQFYHLLPELTVLQNVTIAAMVRYGLVDYSSKEAIPRATELLTSFGLSHRLKHRPTELSGGERQRVAIARALMNDPDVLLADEPTGNLDHATGGKILEALQAVRAARNQTIVMVTHDAEVAGRADRIVRLEDGRVVSA